MAVKGNWDSAVSELYDTFAKYPRNPRIEGCPCCVSNSDRTLLHSRPLRELQSNDLQRYAFKAMTTWGSVDDFRHYLPRILELVAGDVMGVYASIVLGKLEYAGWKDWPDEEQEAVKGLLRVWLTSMVQRATHLPKDEFIWIARLLGDISPMLSSLDLDFDSQGFRLYVDLMESWYCPLLSGDPEFQDLYGPPRRQLQRLLRDNESLLEDAFFHFSTTDPAFAARISDALYTAEHCL